MDLDTLIYIIVMIVFIALGALGKKKKPIQEVSDHETIEEDEFKTTEDVISKKLKAFLGDYEQKESWEEEIEHVTQHVDNTPVPSYYSDESYQQFTGKYKVSEPIPDEILEEVKILGGIEDGLPAFEHFDINLDNDLSDGDLTKQVDPHLQGISAEDVFAEFTEGIDARKAIIYSEIINRKQF